MVCAKKTDLNSPAFRSVVSCVFLEIECEAVFVRVRKTHVCCFILIEK